MDHAAYLGFIPPFLAIALALLTKDVIFSMFLGITSGALIHAGGNPFAALIHVTDLLADKVADSWNIRIFLFAASWAGLSACCRGRAPLRRSATGRRAS